MRGIVVALQLVLLTTLAACGGFGASGEPDAVGGPAVMRRLTESEYRATVADIFGADIPIPARFEQGLRNEGLVAVGTSLSDRTSVVSGKSVSVRLDLGGRRILIKKNTTTDTVRYNMTSQ